jgi:hypothetical protein
LNISAAFEIPEILNLKKNLLNGNYFFFQKTTSLNLVK